MTRDEAEQAALQAAGEYHAVADDDVLVLDDEKTEERPVGWLFWPQSRRFLQTGDWDAEVVGVRPFFVARLTGDVVRVAGTAPTNFEVEGRPSHDFPPTAFAAVPVGALAHALVFGGSWFVADLVLDWLDRIPIVWALVVGAAIGLVAVAPVNVAVRWAAFANVHRAVPIAIAAAGVVLGELSFWAYYADGLAGVPALLAAQRSSYFAIHGVAMVVTIAASSAIGHRDRESQSLWRDD